MQECREPKTRTTHVHHVEAKTSKANRDGWEGLKKPSVTARSVNGGGGVNPKSATKIVLFRKKKKCRMFWNGKICILMKKLAKYVHFDLFYVLDYSGSFDMHIKYEKKTILFQTSAKNRVLSYKGGGLRTLRTGPQRIPVFYWRLGGPQRINKG